MSTSVECKGIHSLHFMSKKNPSRSKHQKRT